MKKTIDGTSTNKRISADRLREISSLTVALAEAITTVNVAQAEHQIAKAKLDRAMRAALLEVGAPITNCQIDEVTGEIKRREG